MIFPKPGPPAAAVRLPASPAEFADPEVRQRWQEERNRIVLKLWSDSHQRTPVVSLESLLRMKREAGRPQDLIDIEELTRLP